jgi:hypothetical protein
VADKMPCAFSDPRPTLKMEAKCSSGGCEGWTEELKWDDATQQWTNGSGLGVFWDGVGNDYRIIGPGKGGTPVSAGGTFACSPFRMTVYNWGPDEDGCTFDIVVSQE